MTWSVTTRLRRRIVTTEHVGVTLRASAHEIVAPRSAVTPRHVHSRQDEAFYALDGEVNSYLEDDVTRATAGSFVWCSRTAPHA
jgi:quercetin dioxygenase-like cupin family protein